MLSRCLRLPIDPNLTRFWDFGAQRAVGVQAKKLLAACVAETSLLSAIYWICCSYALLGHEVDSERRRSVCF